MQHSERWQQGTEGNADNKNKGIRAKKKHLGNMAGCNLIDETEDTKLTMMRTEQVTIRIKQEA